MKQILIISFNPWHSIVLKLLHVLTKDHLPFCKILFVLFIIQANKSTYIHLKASIKFGSHELANNKYKCLWTNGSRSWLSETASGRTGKMAKHREMPFYQWQCWQTLCALGERHFKRKHLYLKLPKLWVGGMHFRLPFQSCRRYLVANDLVMLFALGYIYVQWRRTAQVTLLCLHHTLLIWSHCLI